MRRACSDCGCWKQRNHRLFAVQLPKGLRKRSQRVAIALILRNAWVWVHHQLLATPRRGGRKLNLGILPFKTLLLWLAYLAMQTFGIVDSVAVAQAP
jgi:hypothetical protein